VSLRIGIKIAARMGQDSAISVAGLRKAYGGNDAVAGIDFEVAKGEVFGFLGPNGAGKTTTIEILEGYRPRTAGTVSVLGADPEAPTREWRTRIGLVLQECELNPLLSVEETMKLYASFYPNPRPVDETLRLVGLEDRHAVRVGALSGGQQRRLDVGVGIIGNPELLFLDEPTTGFDPSARREAWNMIEGLKDLGTTIVLTTHYMDEAQHLADRVVILREGRIVAQGAPATLGDQLGRETIIRFRTANGVADRIAAAIGRQAQVSGNQATIASTDPQRDLYRLLSWAEGEGIELPDLEVRRPSLEDVFLEVTGNGAEEEEGR
jgi:ABC-2 type transport system ATP-binding protein